MRSLQRIVATESPGDTPKLNAALGYAARGVPVFPLRPGGKTPLFPGCSGSRDLAGDALARHARECSRDGHGFHDATTDPETIRRWWRDSPEANIGIPAGKVSGFLFLDVDGDRGGWDSLARLEARYGPLPETLRVRTGGGGEHKGLQYVPGFKNRPDAFGPEYPGLDIRTDGGYVVAPGSVTEGRYEVVDQRSPAETPRWLLDAAISAEKQRRETRESAVSASEGSPGGLVHEHGGPIFEGARNTSLTSIAGRLRARGAGDADLGRQLHEVNESRCSPLLPEQEVRQIIRSACRWPVGNAKGAPDAETLQELDEFAGAVQGESWAGMGGRSRRSILMALVQAGRQFGTTIPGGVRVSISIRQLALKAGMSLPTVKRAVHRLRRDGWLSRDDAGRSLRGSGALVLRAKRPHPHHSGGVSPSGGVGSTCAHPLTAPRLRWSAPVYHREGDEVVRETVRRLGKTCEQIVDVLESAGGELFLHDLYGAMYPDKNPQDRRRWRPRDLRKRNISRLEEAGVVEMAGDTVRLAGDWLESLNEERERAGEIQAYRRDLADYDREGKAYRALLDGTAPETAPAPEPGATAEWRESGSGRRREAIEEAIGLLFQARPEYRSRRVGQVTCALVMYDTLPDTFPRGVDPGGPPKDSEVLAVLEANGVEAS